MKMAITILIVLLVVVGGYFIYRYQSPAALAPPTPAPAEKTPAATATAKTHEIIMDVSGFTPANLTVQVGDIVVFRNEDSRTRWPASNLHPTHALCPGFDSLQPVRPSEEYTHVFTRAEECPMHDHLLPSIRGRIIVTP